MSHPKLRHEKIVRPRHDAWDGWPWLGLALAGFLLVLLRWLESDPPAFEG